MQFAEFTSNFAKTDQNYKIVASRNIENDHFLSFYKILSDALQDYQEACSFILLFPISNVCKDKIVILSNATHSF